MTSQHIAEQLSAYLNHTISLAELVNWAEQAMMDGEIDDQDPQAIMDILGRIAAADAQGFGLLWADCDAMLHTLGYLANVQLTKAA